MIVLGESTTQPKAENVRLKASGVVLAFLVFDDSGSCKSTTQPKAENVRTSQSFWRLLAFLAFPDCAGREHHAAKRSKRAHLKLLTFTVFSCICDCSGRDQHTVKSSKRTSQNFRLLLAFLVLLAVLGKSIEGLRANSSKRTSQSFWLLLAVLAFMTVLGESTTPQKAQSVPF